METQERVKALEDAFRQAKDENRQLMLDIRALLMDSMSPLRNNPAARKGPDTTEQ